ncbi:OadG family protein [Teredinibacter purpureus]|jgi:sodium pump decarboxylases, gamma subunit|uniref:OadG family protein n=1 Tax=Teredinibacter purpureus TaxID=2731756 RepID=UPI0005F7B96F|nr:OadG family protein [Teredinibacter purpureus]
MQQNLWEQGLDLMIFGMGTVFVFLTLLVIATLLMSGFIDRFLAEEPEPLVIPTSKSAPPVGKKTLAVIQAAVHAHRAKHQK